MVEPYPYLDIYLLFLLYWPVKDKWHCLSSIMVKVFEKLEERTKMHLLILERSTFYLCLLAVTIEKITCFLNEWKKWYSYRKMYGIQYIFILIIHYAINYLHTALWRDRALSNFLTIWLNSPIIDCPVEDTAWQSLLNDIWWTLNNQTSCPVDWHAKSMAA